MLNLDNAETLRAALESLQAGVCIVDRDRKIVFWNEGAEKITGYLSHEVLGRFCGEVLLIKFHENREALCEHSCPLVAAMKDGQTRESRVYIHHKSGYAVPVSLRAVPIRKAHGGVVGAVESFIERPCGSSRRRRPDSDLVVGQGLDVITQLPDYPFTQSYLADRLKSAAKHAEPFGVLCIQLDQLDVLAVTHGLDAAEALLHVVAHTLRNCLDPVDFVGRWSADQFLAVVMSYTFTDLVKTAERLKRLAQFSEITWWGDPLSVTVSVGATGWQLGESEEVVMQRTRSALQEALAQGGNSVVVLPGPETPNPKEK
jgi:diguanylate cyclase (GGDEF)-like protein/PAS domain S-box-containing protein